MCSAPRKAQISPERPCRPPSGPVGPGSLRYPPSCDRRVLLTTHLPVCACRFSESAAYDAGASKRKETKELIRSLRAVNPNVEINLFASLHKVNLDTLPGYKTNGEMHSFLERL